jgi:hypothetical protein
MVVRITVHKHAPYVFVSVAKFVCAHTMYHNQAEAMDIGVLTYEFGEVWWSILPHLAPAGTTKAQRRAAGLKVLKARLQEYYKTTKVSSKMPISRLTLRKIKSKKHPKLKAKAGQTRCLMPFTLALAKEHRHLDGEMGEHRYLALSLIADVCDMAKQRELTEQQLMQWRYSMAMHMFHYASCGFHVYPKFHYVMHLPQQIQQGGVPRTFNHYCNICFGNCVLNVGGFMHM